MKLPSSRRHAENRAVGIASRIENPPTRIRFESLEIRESRRRKQIETRRAILTRIRGTWIGETFTLKATKAGCTCAVVDARIIAQIRAGTSIQTGFGDTGFRCLLTIRTAKQAHARTRVSIDEIRAGGAILTGKGGTFVNVGLALRATVSGSTKADVTSRFFFTRCAIQTWIRPTNVDRNRA